MTGALATIDRHPLVLVLSYNSAAPSFRYRIALALPHLEALGYVCRVEVLPEQRYGWRVWRCRTLLRSAAVVVLQKLRLPAWELALLRRWCPATVFDVDDAMWVRQPKFVGHRRRPSRRRARRFDGMCSGVSLVTAGNEVLAARARVAGGTVIVLPTPVDAHDYPELPAARNGTVLVWIGMPGNVQYLDPLRPVLARLRERHPTLRLRVISSAFPDWDDVPIERVTWSPAAEKSALFSSDIGVMPLTDDEFTRGKCAFKLLQYMAAGLPCVASRVGMNVDVVSDDVTGYLADTPDEWYAALDRLLGDAALRHRLGQAGRARALFDYDSQVIGPRMAAAIDDVARRAGRIEPSG